MRIDATMRHFIFIGLALMGLVLGCSSKRATIEDAGLPMDASQRDTTTADISDDSSADASSDADGSTDAGPPDLCGDDLLGYPCLTASNTYCPVNGGNECYWVSVRTVCGPPGRQCSASEPACSGADETCRFPLTAGDENGDGICLTEDEMLCFCSNIGASLRPSFCPI